MRNTGESYILYLTFFKSVVSYDEYHDGRNADGIAGRFAGEHPADKIFVRGELHFLPGHHAYILPGISKPTNKINKAENATVTMNNETPKP